MNAEVRVLLGLALPDEQAIEEALYGGDRLSIVAGGSSAGELLALAAAHAADTVLLSRDLPGLDAGCVARLRAKGLRTVGVATEDVDVAALGELDVDAIVQPPLSPAELVEQLRDTGSDEPEVRARSSARADTASGTSAENIVAVIGSKGTPGSTELAASLAALLALQWPVLLAEADGDGGQLAVRVDADPHQGSLLALARAQRRGDPELRELLGGWLAGGVRGWPPVLLAPPDPERALSDTVAPGAVTDLLTLLASEFALVICDVGHRLARGQEPDAAVRLHRDVVTAAGAVVPVLGQRQEQLHAGFRQLELLLDDLGVPAARLRVVVNAQPASGASAESTAAVTRELAARDLVVDGWLPWDARALRASVRLGVPLAVARPRGRYARAVNRFADAMFVASSGQPPACSTRLRVPVPDVAVREAIREVALPWRR